MSRPTLLLLACLTAAPTALAAQAPGHPRAHCSDCGGLREVSDRSLNRRQGFWIAGGLGVGSESFDANDGLGWSDGKAGGVGYVKLGGTVSQSLLLGGEAQIWGARYYGQDYDRTLGSLMFIAQFYPASEGAFWIRGGVGWARDDLTLYSPPPNTLVTGRNGTALAIGLGYDFRVARNVSLTPTLDLVGQHYETHDERVLSLGLGVTFH